MLNSNSNIVIDLKSSSTQAAGEGVWVTDKGDRIEGHFQNHTVKLRMTLSITIVGCCFR